MSDSWTNENILINGAIVEEHKKKFKAALDSKNKQDIIEVLLSLRVNALQTNPDLRTNFVDDLIFQVLLGFWYRGLYCVC